MSDHERPCGCLFKGYEVVSQCIYHTGRQHLIESLQREKEELTRKLGAIDAGHLAKSGGPTMLLLRELDEARAAAITPEMRERIKATVNLWDLCQGDMNADLARDFAPCAMDVLRDLLGEQG